jgi:hypothetical protein
MAFAASQSTFWIFLIAAGLLEIVWSIGMKYSEGFTKLAIGHHSCRRVVCFWLLAIAVEVLPVGNAYAAWTQIASLARRYWHDPVQRARNGCTKGVYLAHHCRYCRPKDSRI